MATKHKGRKKGDWVSVARGRANRDRDLAKRNPTQGINFPSTQETGSAAYRRMKPQKSR